MNFNRGFTLVEYLFLVSFLLIYIFYFFKINNAAKKLNTSGSTSVVKFVIRSVYFGLMALAALGPNFGVTEIEAKESGKDIFFAFDLSESMNASDIEPSRLDKAKGEVLELIKHFETDRIGVIVFNSEAYILSPLTFDHENVNLSIRLLNTSLLGIGSTDFNPVFTLLNEKMGNESKNRAKIAVLVTDGESHFAKSTSTIEALRKNQVGVYFLGVGTLGGAPVPDGVYFKKDKDKSEVRSFLDINQLSDYAKATGGDYFIVDNQRNDSPKLLESISKVTAVSTDMAHQTITYNKYIFFLLPALVLVSVDFLLNIKVLKI